MTINLKSKNTGFSLLEIIMVMIIVGLLAGLALPRFGSSFERVRSSEGVQLLTALLEAQKAFEAENGNYTTTIGSLDITVDRASHFDVVAGPPASPDADDGTIGGWVARIKRTNGYWLEIDQDGVISCSDPGGETFVCTDIGM